MKIQTDIPGADAKVETDTADEFKKAVLSALMDSDSVPLINIWWSNKTHKLNYSVGSGVVNGTPQQKGYLMLTIMKIVEENGLLPKKGGS